MNDETRNPLLYATLRTWASEGFLQGGAIVDVSSDRQKDFSRRRQKFDSLETKQAFLLKI